MASILIIRLSALGDVAMTIPAIYSLARQYPELHIDVLTRPFFARLFIDAPRNVKVVKADYKGRHGGVRGTLRLLRELSKLKPDCVADLHNVSRSWIIDAWFRLRGVKVAMVDKNRRQRGRLFSEKIAQRNFVDRYADVFARLGYPVHTDFISLFEHSAAEPPFEPEHPAIGIAPFARYYNKAYPPELMRRTIKELTRKGYHVYLFGGGAQECDDLRSWANDSTMSRSVAGLYSIEQELALMSRLDLMVSMDSANQHLASLAGTKVCTIWGSTTPACGFVPYGSSAERGVCLNLPCQPCSVAGKPTCPQGHFDCMTTIAPAAIVAKVEQMVPITSQD